MQDRADKILVQIKRVLGRASSFSPASFSVTEDRRKPINAFKECFCDWSSPADIQRSLGTEDCYGSHNSAFMIEDGCTERADTRKKVALSPPWYRDLHPTGFVPCTAHTFDMRGD